MLMEVNGQLLTSAAYTPEKELSVSTGKESGKAPKLSYPDVVTLLGIAPR
jgi:hypothetical protein